MINGHVSVTCVFSSEIITNTLVWFSNENEPAWPNVFVFFYKLTPEFDNLHHLKQNVVFWGNCVRSRFELLYL